MTDEETRNSQYWEERSEELSTEQLKDVSGGGFCKPDPYSGVSLVGRHKGNSRPKLKTPETEDGFRVETEDGHA